MMHRRRAIDWLVLGALAVPGPLRADPPLKLRLQFLDIEVAMPAGTIWRSDGGGGDGDFRHQQIVRASPDTPRVVMRLEVMKTTERCTATLARIAGKTIVMPSRVLPGFHDQLVDAHDARGPATSLCAELQDGILRVEITGDIASVADQVNAVDELLIAIHAALDPRQATVPKLRLPVTGLTIAAPEPAFAWRTRVDRTTDGIGYDTILLIDGAGAIRMSVEVRRRTGDCAAYVSRLAASNPAFRIVRPPWLPIGWTPTAVRDTSAAVDVHAACSPSGLSALVTSDDDRHLRELLAAIHAAATAPPPAPPIDERDAGDTEPPRRDWNPPRTLPMFRLGRGHQGIVALSNADWDRWTASRLTVMSLDTFFSSRHAFGVVGYYGYDLFRAASIGISGSAIAKDMTYIELRLGVGLQVRTPSAIIATGLFAAGDYGDHRDRSGAEDHWSGSLSNVFVAVDSDPIDLWLTLSPYVLHVPSTGTLIVRTAPLRIEARATAVTLPAGPGATLGDAEIDAAATISNHRGWGPLAGVAWRRVWIAPTESARDALSMRDVGHSRVVFDVGLHFPAITLGGSYRGGREWKSGWVYINSVQLVTAGDRDGRLYGIGINRLQDYGEPDVPLRENVWLLFGAHRFEIGIAFQGRI